MQTYQILIVDDEQENLKSIVQFIEEMDLPYELYQALNGKTALEIALAKLPDLIISDWDMPQMDGLELVKSLKANELTREIPVIMFTGVMTTFEHLEMALDAGAIEYIRKPLNQVELLARVRTVLQLSDSFKMIVEQKKTLMDKNGELRKKQAELQEAFSNIKILAGLLPICANCKKIRDDKGYYQQIEHYITDHSEAEFTHGICPDCAQNLYPDIDLSYV